MQSWTHIFALSWSKMLDNLRHWSWQMNTLSWKCILFLFFSYKVCWEILSSFSIIPCQSCQSSIYFQKNTQSGRNMWQWLWLSFLSIFRHFGQFNNFSFLSIKVAEIYSVSLFFCFCPKFMKLPKIKKRFKFIKMSWMLPKSTSYDE